MTGERRVPGDTPSMKPNWGGTEGWLARGVVGVVAGVACLFLAPWFLVTAIPRGRRIQIVVPIAGGMVLGLFGWLSWLGPLLLP